MVLIVCVAILLQGKFREVDIYTDYVYVKHGDTFFELIEPYYDKCDSKYLSWDEYRINQKEMNKKLFENGRSLQPGDCIKVEWYKFRE